MPADNDEAIRVYYREPGAMLDKVRPLGVGEASRASRSEESEKQPSGRAGRVVSTPHRQTDIKAWMALRRFGPSVPDGNAVLPATVLY